MVMRTPAATARGVLAGALGGAIGGAVDYGLARSGAAQFMPGGSGRLLAFLVTLYGGLGGLGGGLVAIALSLFGWATDLGPLARRAFAVAEADPIDDRGARLGAYAVAGLLSFGLLGGALHAVTLNAFTRFHGHLLIAALVGAVGAGLAIASVLLVFALAALLSPLLRFGPRLRTTPRMPPAWTSLFSTLGLLVGAAAVLKLVDGLALRPRMSHEVRALNVALWGPTLLLAALVLAHVAARLSWRALGSALGDRGATRSRWPASMMGSVTVTLALPAVVVAFAVALGLGASWSTAKLLPWKPFVAGAAALAGAIAAALGGVGARLDRRGYGARAVAVVVVPALLLAVGLRLGEAERVRKAAIAHTGLAGPLIDGIHAVSDLDHDGYASLLGSDCDDFNPDVHPGAFDWPDDGIDQDCNGHQATSKPRARMPFAALPPSVPSLPNVLLITIDAVRADHLGAYGYARPTSPRIDAFARESTLFKNGWAHSPSTRYSVPAILTGRYESTIAWGSPAQHWPPPVLPANRLLSEMFKEHGYRTAAFLPYHYFERSWGLDQGFDDYDYSLSRLHGNPFNGDPSRTTGSSSKELADLAIGWLDAHAATESHDRADPRNVAAPPFFLWLHFYDPHYLYERHPDCAACNFGDSETDRYDGEIAFTDIHVGRVLDELKRLGAWDRTVTLLTSDHGEGLGEHGVSQHGYHIYAQQTRVPFIVHVPGIPPGRVDEPVGHVDIFPSLLNLLGARDEPQLYGRTFVDLMLGTDDKRPREVFGEVEYEGPVVRKAVATRDWHLIDNVVPDHTVELYHLSEDPEEAHDVSGYGLSEEKQLRGDLAAWMDEIALPPDFAARVAGNLSPTPLPFETPLGADIGGMLFVDGVDVKTPTVRWGGEAEIDLVMHAPKAIPAGWRLFTHFTAADGRFINADHQPVENFIPLQKIKPGQFLRDRIKVTVPIGYPGPLTVEVGLYRGNERAAVTSSKGAGNVLYAATLKVEK